MTKANIADFTFTQVEVGSIFSFDRTFTAEDIDIFASVSGDFSPLHMDLEYANTTEFGGRVVHGILLASLFSNLVGMKIPGKHALYLGQDLVFRRPVLIGDRVTVSAKVLSKNAATQTFVLLTEIRTEDDKIAVSGTAKVKVRSPEVISSVADDSSSPSTKTVTGRQRVAIITGASRGIGAEIAHKLGGQNICIIVNYYRSQENAEKLVNTIQDNGGTAIAVQADIREEKDCQKLVDVAIQNFGRLDFIVNGATGDLEQCPFQDMEWKHFQYQLDFQLKGVFQMCQSAYPYLQQSDCAAIVNIVSQVTFGSPPTQMIDYVSAKYALKGLSKSLAIEWANEPIRVNTVSPGLTRTDLTQYYNEKVFKIEASRTPLKRLANVADIANTVSYLLSDEARFLTGIDISITGGQVMN